MDEQTTIDKMSDLADRFILDYGARELSFEELEELMETEARNEEADDRILSDQK